MADITVDADAVSPVVVNESTAGVGGAAFPRGTVVRRDATSGKWLPSDASAAGTAAVGGIALEESFYDGSAITILRDGTLDLGKNALNGKNFGASIYLSDTDSGKLADAAGTVSVIVGTVEPAWASGPTAADRLLRVKL